MLYPGKDDGVHGPAHRPPPLLNARDRLKQRNPCTNATTNVIARGSLNIVAAVSCTTAATTQRLARVQGFASSVHASAHHWSWLFAQHQSDRDLAQAWAICLQQTHTPTLIPLALPASQGNKSSQCRLTPTFYLEAPRGPTCYCCNPRECPAQHDIRTAAMKSPVKRSREYTRSCGVVATTQPDLRGE